LHNFSRNFPGGGIYGECCVSAAEIYQGVFFTLTMKTMVTDSILIAEFISDELHCSNPTNHTECWNTH